MLSLAEIREDLKDIKYYYSRKEVFEKVSDKVGKNSIIEKITKYNNVVCKASPRLYDIYVSLYLENHTQETLSDKLGYSFEYVSKLNCQLVRFFQKEFDKEVHVDENAG